jgi:hypothetical protein
MLLVACSNATPGPNSGPSDSAPSSLREQLATKTRLTVTPDRSAGSITAQHRTNTGWDQGRVDLTVEDGELIVSTDGRGRIVLSAIESGFQTVTLPPNLLGRDAQLANLRLQLNTPASVTPTWNGDNEAQADASLDFGLSWSLAINGTRQPLGEPKLTPFPAKLLLTSDGAQIVAEVRVHAPGELWNWADLLELSDFDLVLGAQAPVGSPAPGAGSDAPRQ